jgi:competence protein ComEC
MAILLCMAAGFLLLPLLPTLPPPWLVLLLALFVSLAAKLSRWRLLWGLAAFLLTFSWSVLQATRALDARLPAAWEGVTLMATGHIRDLPEAVPRGQRFRLQPDSLRGPAGEVIAAPGQLQLFIAEPTPVLPDAYCQMSVRLKRPHGAANPGGFDYEVWLLSENVMATGTAKALQCEAPAGYSMAILRWQMRQTFLREFPQQPQAGVLLALITGDRALIAPLDWERYVATGVVHLMAISGLHITMLAMMGSFLAFLFLRRLPQLALYCPLHKPALLTGLLLALVYSLIAGFSVPTQRTLIMLAVVMLAACSERRLPSLQILLLALIAVLLWSPLAVHAAGFWLSFGAVAILLVQGQGRQGEPLWRRVLILQFLMSLLLLPLTLWFFERASVVSPLANLLAIPLITFIVVPAGLLGLLAGLFALTTPAHWCWQLGIFVLAVLDALLEQMQSWQWASVDWSLSGWGAMLCFCLALFCLLQPLRASLRCLAPLFLLPLLWPVQTVKPGQLRVMVIDVGQGLAVLLQTEHHRLLYDTGPVFGPGSDAGLRHILPALHQNSVHKLDMLILSHDDNDHTGGAASLLTRMPVAAVTGVRPQNVRVPYGLHWQSCRAGRFWDWDGWRFELLYPDEEEWQQVARDNNRSCVLRVSRGDAAILLPGDLEGQGEQLLLARLPAASLQADVLVLGHHGSRNSSSPEWLAVVRPQLAIASAGYRNAFGHPSPALLERLRIAGIPWRNTANTGALTLTLQPGHQMVVQEFRRESGRYWQDGETASIF